jgi:hypothetical protein
VICVLRDPDGRRIHAVRIAPHHHAYRSPRELRVHIAVRRGRWGSSASRI